MLEALSLLAVFFPFVIGIINYIVVKKFPKARLGHYVTILVIELLFVIAIAILFILNGKDHVDFIFNDLFHFAISLRLDNYRIFFHILVMTAYSISLILSRKLLKDRSHSDHLYLFMNLSFGSVIGLLYSGDLLTSFICITILSFASFPLVLFIKEGLDKSYHYVLVNVITSFISLVGIALIYSETNTFIYHELYTYSLSNDIGAITIAGGLLTVFGILSRLGIFPFINFNMKMNNKSYLLTNVFMDIIIPLGAMMVLLNLVNNLYYNNLIFYYSFLVIGVITSVICLLNSLNTWRIDSAINEINIYRISKLLIFLGFICLKKTELTSLEFSLQLFDFTFFSLAYYLVLFEIERREYKLDKKVFYILLSLVIFDSGLIFFNTYNSLMILADSSKWLIYVILFLDGLKIASLIKYMKKNYLEEKMIKKLNISTSIYLFTFMACYFVISIIPYISSYHFLPSMSAYFFNVEGKVAIELLSIKSIYITLIPISTGFIIYFVYNLLNNKYHLEREKEILNFDEMIFIPFVKLITALINKTYLALKSGLNKIKESTHHDLNK